MKSKLLLMLPNIKSNQPLKKLDFNLIMTRELPILKNSLLILKLLRLLKKMLGLSQDNLIKMLLTLKTSSLLKKHSITKKLIEEMVKKLILTGLLNSSKNKLLLLVKLLEVESTIMSMMKDSTICLTEEVMQMLPEGKI